MEYALTSIAICRLDSTLRLLGKVDFRSSFYTRDPCRLNHYATGQAIIGLCNATGELIYYSMFE
jgi:hypothetical protein